MTEEQIRKIIREELASIIGTERFTLQKHLQMFDGKNIQFGKGTGTQIGTETTQKLAFYGVTPIIQPGSLNDVSVGSIAGANTVNATTVQTALDDLVYAHNQMLDVLQILGLHA